MSNGSVSYRIELERSILAIVMWDAEKLTQATTKLDLTSFADPRHAVIFKTLQAMAAAGSDLDASLVVLELKRLGQIDAAGGDQFVVALSVDAGGSDPRRLAFLIKNLVVELHRSKTLLDLQSITQRSASGVEDLKTVLADALSKLSTRSDEIDSQVQRLPIMTLDEILSTPPDPDAWLIRGILPQQGVIVLAGLPKQGKTLIAQQWGLSIASNQETLDREIVKTGPVVFVGLEGSRNSFLTRIQMQCAGLGISNKGIPFHLITRPKRELLKINGPLWNELEATCAAVKPAMVVIDPLTWISDSDENNNDEMSRQVMLPLQQFAVRHDCLVLVIHHMKKPSSDEKAPDAGDFVGNLATKIRGASAIVGGSDGNFSFELMMGKGGIQNTQTYRLVGDMRDAPGFTGYLRRDPTTLLYELTVAPAEQARETFDSSDPMPKLVKWMAANAGTKAKAKTIGELSDKQTGLGFAWATAKKHLETAFAKGLIEKGQDGSRWVYWLAAGTVVPQEPVPTLTNGTPIDQAPKTAAGLTASEFDADPSDTQPSEDALFD